MQQQQDQTLLHEKAIFRNTVNQNYIKSQKVLSVLQQDKWQIENGQYLQNQWQCLFPHMDKCYAEILRLVNNGYPSTIKQIQNVNFIHLTQLQIHYNNIDNIEPLTLMNFQHLKLLNISYNYISQMKCLNKLNKPFLNQISLCNQLNEMNSLTRAKLHSQDCIELILQLFFDQDPIVADLSIIFKLNSKQFNRIRAKCRKRIRQINIWPMLRKKFPSMSMDAIEYDY